MSCRYTEKIILLKYGEIPDDKDFLLKHIENCSECKNTFNMIEKFDRLPLINPLKKTENEILIYAKNIKKYALFSFRKIALSTLFSLVSIAVFLIPVKEVFINQDIDKKINNLTSELNSIEYEFKFDDTDIYFNYDSLIESRISEDINNKEVL